MYDTTQIVDCKEKKTIFFVNFFCSKVFTRRFSYVKMTKKPIFGGFMVYVLNFSAMTDEEKAAYDQKLKAMEEAMQQDKELQKQFY